METILSILLLFLTLFLFTIYLLSRQKCDVPGPPAWPLFGNLLLLQKMQKVDSKAGFIETLAKKYGPILRLYLGPFPIVYVCGYKNVDYVLHNQDFTDRPDWIPIIRMARKMRKGCGITWSNGESWKAIRRFSMKTMREFGIGKTSMEEKILEEVKSLTEEFERSVGTSVDNVRDLMTYATCNVLHQTIFGYRYNYDNQHLQKLVSSFHDMFTGFGILTIDGLLPFLKLFMASTWKINLRGRKHVQKYIFDQIQGHRDSFDGNNIRDFVDLYIQTENEQTDGISNFGKGELFSIIMELFVAGTDTSASTLNSTLLYMIAYPRVQQKCHDEITNVIGHGRMIRNSDRPRLKYTEATLMEIQRLSTTASLSVPRMANRDTKIDNFSIEKGTTVVVVLASVHKDNAVWEDPLTFRPERFLDEDGNIINHACYMPFSAGARNCPGESLARLEVFLVFANLLQRFTFTKVEPTDELSFKEITEVISIVPKYRLKVSLR